jgi:1-deoxy-D-xylulose 5-phosphate reductoisomerase
MIIPLANAIFEKNLDIADFLKPKTHNKNSMFVQSLNFTKVHSKRFPLIKLKNRLLEYYSTPIIVNAVNEILVDQYLQKKIPFTSFYDHLLDVLNDRNYKEYAVKIPKNIKQIFQIDQWARNITYKKLKLKKDA